jgi:hypothetical protein
MFSFRRHFENISADAFIAFHHFQSFHTGRRYARYLLLIISVRAERQRHQAPLRHASAMS